MREDEVGERAEERTENDEDSTSSNRISEIKTKKITHDVNKMNLEEVQNFLQENQMSYEVQEQKDCSDNE